MLQVWHEYTKTPAALCSPRASANDNDNDDGIRPHTKEKRTDGLESRDLRSLLSQYLRSVQSCSSDEKKHPQPVIIDQDRRNHFVEARSCRCIYI
uniref:Uncharacterized protein n=1 Tax=Trichogramma kaykai TaxID=54128 RepID=A0ABD2W9C3_9HYME